MGSEMCIRDSDHPGADRVDPNPVLLILALYQLAQRVQAELADGCLLYTSDAADERSSVDLGGRRIIKKKTYINMTC